MNDGTTPGPSKNADNTHYIPSPADGLDDDDCDGLDDDDCDGLDDDDCDEIIDDNLLDGLDDDFFDDGLYEVICETSIIDLLGENIVEK